MKNYLIVLSILFTSLAFINAQQKTKIYADKGESYISYDMTHPMHDWTGISKSVSSAIICNEAKDSISQVAVSVKISSFDSDNSNRDSHAMEVTEAIKFPSISFISTSISYQSASKLLVVGTLKFHGISKNISFEVNQEILNKKAVITGSFWVKMSDFKIEAPSLMGIDTDDDFKIHFRVVY